MKKFFYCVLIGIFSFSPAHAFQIDRQSTSKCRIESARIVKSEERVQIRGQSRRTMSYHQAMGAHIDVVITDGHGKSIKSVRVPFGVITPRQDSINNYRSVFSADFSKEDFSHANHAIVRYCVRSDCI